MEKIHVLHQESNKRELLFLEEMPATIGRSTECSVLIEDGLVAEVHARIEVREDGGYRVVDLSAGEGVWVNGERVDEVLDFGEGDAIRLGAVEVFLGRVGDVPREDRDAAGVEQAEDKEDSGEAAGSSSEETESPGASRMASSAVKKAVGLLRKMPGFALPTGGNSGAENDASDAISGEELDHSVAEKTPRDSASEQDYEPGSFWSRGVQHMPQPGGEGSKSAAEESEERQSPDFQRRRIFPKRLQDSEGFSEQDYLQEPTSEQGANGAAEGNEAKRELLDSPSGEQSAGMDLAGTPGDDATEVKGLSVARAALVEEIALLREQEQELRSQRRSLEKQVARERARLVIVEQELLERRAEVDEMDQRLAEQKGRLAAEAGKSPAASAGDTKQ